MTNNKNRTTEEEISIAMMQVCAANHDGMATFDNLKIEIPKILNLTDGDLTVSKTRPNEHMWEQILRNIKSHSIGNFIAEGYIEHIPREGYKITKSGRLYLKK